MTPTGARATVWGYKKKRKEGQEEEFLSIRLPGHDYSSPGAYFVTVCVDEGECLLGEVVNGGMELSEWSKIAWDCWQAIPEHFPHVELNAFAVVPNHIHGIVVITRPVVGAQYAAPLQAPPTDAQPGPLGVIIRSFKSAATRRINRLRGMPGSPFWQRNYWEHIIRNDASLNRIRTYIQSNPAHWAEDRLHPSSRSRGQSAAFPARVE